MKSNIWEAYNIKLENQNRVWGHRKGKREPKEVKKEKNGDYVVRVNFHPFSALDFTPADDWKRTNSRLMARVTLFHSNRGLDRAKEIGIYSG